MEANGQAVEAVTTVERFLTIISLCIIILGAVGGFTWKITRTLNALLGLPGEVREVIGELQKMNHHIGEIRGESRAWRQAADDWHQQHLDRYHSTRRRT